MILKVVENNLSLIDDNYYLTISLLIHKANNSFSSKENENNNNSFNGIIEKIHLERKHFNSNTSSNGSNDLTQALNNIYEKILLTDDHLIDTGVSKFNINFKDLHIILIDDQANTYYPFLSLFFSEINFSNSYQIEKKNGIFLSTYFKVIIYNYFASKCEALIKKSIFQIEILTDYLEENEISRTINISLPTPKNNHYSAFNINISDISVCSSFKFRFHFCTTH